MEKALGNLVNGKLSMSLQCALAAKRAKLTQRSIKHGILEGIGGNGLSYSALCWTSLPCVVLDTVVVLLGLADELHLNSSLTPPLLEEEGGEKKTQRARGWR